MDPFIKVIEWFQQKGINFSLKEKCFFRSRTLVTVAEPYHCLMQQDEVVEHLYFLNSGIVRLFRHYHEIDYTLGFVDSIEFVSTPLYVLNGEKSTCSLETLTQADMLQWSYEDLIAFKKYMPQLAYSMELALLDRLLQWVQQNQIEMICLSAEERYKILLERHPEVVLKIPLKYIASYLGIHTDSLSRIRKKVL